MYNFPSLTKKNWATDYGFRKALEVDPGTMKFGGLAMGTGRRDIVEYWQREKSHYRLWELLLYMGSHTVPQTVAYFDLPADTAEFLRWVYNDVSHEQREQVEEMVQDFASGFDQMNFFPTPNSTPSGSGPTSARPARATCLSTSTASPSRTGWRYSATRRPAFLSSPNYGAAGAVMLQKLTNLCSC